MFRHHELSPSPPPPFSTQHYQSQSHVVRSQPGEDDSGAEIFANTGPMCMTNLYPTLGMNRMDGNGNIFGLFLSCIQCMVLPHLISTYFLLSYLLFLFLLFLALSVPHFRTIHSYTHALILHHHCSCSGVFVYSVQVSSNGQNESIFSYVNILSSSFLGRC